MALSIIALCVFLFGAYAYGSVVVLTIRHRSPVWQHSPLAFPLRALRKPGMPMYLTCTVWFILHSLIEFRYLMGEPRENDFIDLAALELAFVFPGLIFHTVLLETDAGQHEIAIGRWRVALVGLYIAGVALATYVTLAIFEVIPAPHDIGSSIGYSMGGLFSAVSILCLWLMATRRKPSATPDQLRLRTAMMILFVVMMVIFIPLSLQLEQKFLMGILGVLTRATPLAFLLVSIYFENRTEFYDLVIKRGVIMLLTLVAVVVTLATTLDWLEKMPGGMARPWLFAVVLLPVVMLLPWLHDRVGRLLDRLWFGREFTPVEAVKRVLGGMQQATDEAALIAATQATLSDMFRRPMTIVMEDQPIPPGSTLAADVRLSAVSPTIRLVTTGLVGRPLLSEDLALLRSLGGVFAYMLENVRLQRKRQEQEQIANELRLQTSRSELKALRAQINPHFLFNALNAIASLIHTDPARADAAVEQLAEVFRYTLRRSEQEWAPLDQELAFARAYLEVEQARFGRRLEFSISASPDVARAQVPSMLLQTLVENAVKHGISRLRTPGRIEVSATQQAGELTLEVRDTGPGIDAFTRPSPSGESFGLRSVRDRLEGHFGAQASLDLFRDNQQTLARIRMPLVRELTGVAGGVR